MVESDRATEGLQQQATSNSDLEGSNGATDIECPLPGQAPLCCCLGQRRRLLGRLPEWQQDAVPPASLSTGAECVTAPADGLRPSAVASCRTQHQNQELVSAAPKGKWIHQCAWVV